VFYYPEATFWTNKQVLFNRANPPPPSPPQKIYFNPFFHKTFPQGEQTKSEKKSILYFFCPIFRVEVNLAMWKT